MRIIARLSSGYTTAGRMLPYMPEVRCPDCGTEDSIAHFERRSKLVQWGWRTRSAHDLEPHVREFESRLCLLCFLLLARKICAHLSGCVSKGNALGCEFESRLCNLCFLLLARKICAHLSGCASKGNALSFILAHTTPRCRKPEVLT